MTVSFFLLTVLCYCIAAAYAVTTLAKATVRWFFRDK